MGQSRQKRKTIWSYISTTYKDSWFCKSANMNNSVLTLRACQNRLTMSIIVNVVHAHVASTCNITPPNQGLQNCLNTSFCTEYALNTQLIPGMTKIEVHTRIVCLSQVNMTSTMLISVEEGTCTTTTWFHVNAYLSTMRYQTGGKDRFCCVASSVAICMILAAFGCCCS